MSDVSAGTVTSEEAPFQVDVRWKSFNRRTAVVDEFQNIESIFVLARTAMLWSETVVYRDDYGGDFSSKPLAEVVEEFGIGSHVYESAAVKIDDQRQRLGGEFGGRSVETEPEVAGGIDGDIEAFDAVLWFLERRRLEIQKVREEAID